MILYWVPLPQDTNFSNANNYSTTSGGIGGSGAPTINDDIIFNSLSSGNCTMTASGDCKTITTQSGYLGTFNTNSQPLVSASGVNFLASGNLTISSKITVIGDGNFIIGSTVGTCTLTTCDIDVQGTGDLTIGPYSKSCRNITHSYPGKTTTWKNFGTYSGLTGVNSIKGGTWTLQNTLYHQIINNTNPIVTVAGYTWNGDQVTYYLISNDTSDITINLPGLTWSGNYYGGFDFYKQGANSNVILSLQGHQVHSYFWRFENSIGTGSLTVNTNNYNITTAYQITWTSSNSGGTLTVNLGSSTLSTVYFTPGAVAGSIINVNMQSCIFNITGYFTWHAAGTSTVDVGSSIVNFVGSSAGTITSNGKPFYDIVITKGSNSPTVTLIDLLSCHSLTTTAGANGNFNAAGFAITSISTVSFASTGTVSLGNVTITGDGDFTVASTIGTLTITSCNLDCKGTGSILQAKGGGVALPLKSVTCSYPGKTTTCLGFWTELLNLSGGILVTTVGVTVSPRVTSTCITTVAGYSITGVGVQVLPFADGITITVPALTLTSIYLGPSYSLTPASYGCTITLAGNINCGSSDWFIRANAPGKDFILNTAGYSITGGYLTIGSQTVTSTMTCNFGSSVISCTYFNGGTINTTQAMNFNTSVWTCTGNWVMGTFWTVDPGQSTINITNTSTITSLAKTFYNLVLNADTKTIQTADALSCNRLLVKPGTTAKFKNGVNTTVANYTSGDIDGTVAKKVTLRSVLDNSSWNYVNPAGMDVNNVDVKDSNATNSINAFLTNGNIDSLNNINWLWIQILNNLMGTMSNKSTHIHSLTQNMLVR